MGIFAKYEVIVDGKVVTLLNDLLAQKQGLTDQEIRSLVETHVTRYHLFEAAKTSMNPAVLKSLAAAFEQLEFEQQRLWHFPEDRNFHRWFDFPGCSCPKIDNAENIGFDRRIHVSSCLVHRPSTWNEAATWIESE